MIAGVVSVATCSVCMFCIAASLIATLWKWCREKGLVRRSHQTRQLNRKQLLLRSMLLLWTLLQFPYYLHIYVSAVLRDPTAEWVQTWAYSCHLLAMSVLAATFIVLCTLCMDLLANEGASASRKPATWVSILLVFLYMTVTFWLVIINQIYGFEYVVTNNSFVYKFYFFWHAGTLFVICVVFLAYSQLIRRALTPRGSTSKRQRAIIRKLNFVLCVCSLCFLLRITMTTALYITNGQANDFLHQLPDTIWYALSQWIPDYPLVVIVFYLSRPASGNGQSVLTLSPPRPSSRIKGGEGGRSGRAIEAAAAGLDYNDSYGALTDSNYRETYDDTRGTSKHSHSKHGGEEDGLLQSFPPCLQVANKTSHRSVVGRSVTRWFTERIGGSSFVV